MISKRWRGRLTYLVMSVFVGWHTLAMMVAPAPDSVAAQSLRSVLHPYLSFFWLDHKWDFYAPSVGRGHQLRYVVEDPAGTPHTFLLAEDLSWFHPNYWWVSAWHDAIVESPDTYGDYVVAYICQKHALLHPISITLLNVEELDFSPEDHLNGKDPMDSEFVTETTLKHDTCPD